MSRGRNFAVTQSLEERKLDRLPLKSGQRSHALFEKLTQIAAHKRIEHLATWISWPLLQLFSITLPRAAIGLASAQSVNGAAPCNRYYPAERLACLRRVMIRLFPNLEKNLLEYDGRL